MNHLFYIHDVWLAQPKCSLCISESNTALACNTVWQSKCSRVAPLHSSCFKKKQANAQWPASSCSCYEQGEETGVWLKHKAKIMAWAGVYFFSPLFMPREECGMSTATGLGKQTASRWWASWEQWQVPRQFESLWMAKWRGFHTLRIKRTAVLSGKN